MSHHQNPCQGRRPLHLLKCANLIDATRQAAQISNTHLTIIDMTVDLNQNRWLGQELGDTLIYMDSATKPNGLLAVLGCVKAPHKIFIGYDPQTINDYFKQSILLPALENIATNAPVSSVTGKKQVDDDNNDEILAALRALQHHRGVVHLVGERGSGKSTLLGQFIVQHICSYRCHILLSSPIHAASKNTLAAIERNQSQVSRETLTYCPPQTLVKALDLAQLIIIDEAATYPKNVLEKVITHCQENNKKLILSTTIEGYEGTGQAYRLHYLNQNDKVIKLNSPRRFSEQDPVYQFCRQLYQPSRHVGTAGVDDGIWLFNTMQLREQGLTAACFALLRDAHYKTTPNDLARFYNDTAIFAVSIENQTLVAAAQGFIETLPNDISPQAIFNGVRRTKNALTQQALLHAYAIDNTLIEKRLINSQILRISRIATATTHRRRGIAMALITRLQDYASESNVDFISTSFSASTATMQFWLSQAFIPVRIGLYPNKANNEYAVLMLASAQHHKSVAYLNALFEQHVNFFKHSYLPHHACLMGTLAAKHLPKSLHFVQRGGQKGVQKGHGIITAADMQREIDSVTRYHRDVNWALPGLSQEKESRVGQKWQNRARILDKSEQKILIDKLSLGCQ